MACRLTVTLLTESQTGSIGNDWTYSLEVRVFHKDTSGDLTGEGTIRVPEHRLDSGKTQVPPGPPADLVLPAGEAGAAIFVDLRFSVAEVDVLQNDVADTTGSFKMTCPAAGGPPVVEEREIWVSVVEQPSGIGRAVVRLTYRVTLESD